MISVCRAGFTWVLVCGLSSAACDFDDPEPASSAANPPHTLVASTPVSAAASVVLAVAKSPQASSNSALEAVPALTVDLGPVSHSTCPEHMLEVHGDYCEDLVHRCIKGGKSHTGEDDEQPEPFYCDVYQTGFAKCFGKEESKHFCIDEFEYPNQEGALPMVMVSWFEGQRLCGLRGKRLCGDDEWTLACEGPERRPYPYGWARDRTVCNIDHLWVAPNDALLANKLAAAEEIQAEVDRLSRRVPSGSMPGCKSAYGVMDMTGNVDEWAVNVTRDAKPYRSAFKGGHWVSGARNRCRPVTTSHDENTAYYAEGFRCCADLPLTAAK